MSARSRMNFLKIILHFHQDFLYHGQDRWNPGKFCVYENRCVCDEIRMHDEPFVRGADMVSKRICLPNNGRSFQNKGELFLDHSAKLWPPYSYAIRFQYTDCTLRLISNLEKKTKTNSIKVFGSVVNNFWSLKAWKRNWQ